MPSLTATQRQALIDDFHSPFSAHSRADFYLRLAQFMDDAYPYPDSPPDEYRAAILWLRGAAEVNSNSGSQSDFIRAYNKAQVEARTGQSLTDAEMDAVSNAVAQKVYDKLMEGQAAEFPTIDILAEDDAAPAAVSIFANNNMGGWAGNHLFLALGHSEAFYANIIEPGSSTYDAIAMMKFAAEIFGSANLGDALSQVLSYPAGVATVLTATNALDAFLVAAYGANALTTGAQIVASYETILGRTQDADELHGTEDADLIHGGGGDDTVYGSDGGDLIDGAEGRDVVDYALVDWGNRFILKEDVQSSAGYVGSVVRTGLFPNDATALFGFEEIRAGDADDEVQLMGLPASLERIDGGDQGELGDLLSAFYASQGISFDMEGGLLAIGDATLEAVGFERVEGSGHNDVISGNDQSNAIKGGYGSDSLFGGGADDFIFFDAADEANVYGGTGRDVAVALGDTGVTVDMAAQGLECVIGCDGDDTIIVSGATESRFAAGSSGADTFRLSFGQEAESPRVLWGGDGADTFIFEDSMNGGIAVVNVAGLTEEAFANLTLDDLDLAGLPINEFRAIIINPDASDRFVVDGSEYDTGISLEDSVFRSLGSDFISSWLGREISVQGHFADSYSTEVMAEVEWDEMENVVSISWWDGTWDGRAVKRYDPLDEAEQERAREDVAYYDENLIQIVVQPDTFPEYGPWNGPIFVVGGTFDGAALSSNGALTGTVPVETGPSPFDWLLVA